MRKHAICIIASLCVALPAVALAQDGDPCEARLQGQTITLAVPNSAGGGFDIYARSLAPVLQEISGARVRVSNLPGGGGAASLLRVLNAQPEDAALVLVHSTNMILMLGDNESLGHEPHDFQALAVVHAEPETWLGRPGFDLTEETDAPMIVAASSVEGNLVSVSLVAMTLGREVAYVSGYEGSSDMIASVLRGETDLTSKSMGTSLRAIRSGDVELLLVLSDGPSEEAPTAPYLLGDGGLLWSLTADLPEAEREERRHLARLAADFSVSERLVLASARMDPDLRDCLAPIVEAAVLDPSFRDAAEAQGRPVAAEGTEAARAVLDLKVATHDMLAPILRDLAAASGQ